MVETTNRYAPTRVSPPGDTLREILEDRGISQADLALRMGRPQKTISEIVNGKAAITPETALQLELVTGVPAAFWNARENNYRAFLAQQEATERLGQLRAWCNRFPLAAMERLGWVPATSGVPARAHALLTFFGVAAPDQWEELFSSYAVQFRRPAKFSLDRPALSAWLRRGELEAGTMDTSFFDAERFRAALVTARSLTKEPPEVFQPQLVKECAGAGVAVVFVPELPKSRASGATRWLSPAKALIQLSLRYKTNDHLWFTFFHEAAHILLHGKRAIFIEDHASPSQPEESEANEWAANFLIDRRAYEAFVNVGDLSPVAISSFAHTQGIAPGIVAGRLQHDGYLPHNRGNQLKITFSWKHAA